MNIEDLVHNLNTLWEFKGPYVKFYVSKSNTGTAPEIGLPYVTGARTIFNDKSIEMTIAEEIASDLKVLAEVYPDHRVKYIIMIESFDAQTNLLRYAKVTNAHLLEID